jgi:hypothetical protein
MILLNTLLIGIREIASHWFRSTLTILGVVLGIVSLVTMSAIVKGMENAMRMIHPLIRNINRTTRLVSLCRMHMH